MLGYIEYGDSPKRPELSQRQLAGGTFAVLALPLRRALAAPLVRRRLEDAGLDPAQAVVALSGDRPLRELTEAAKALALNYRYVLLSVRGGEEFARDLRREYGISLLLKPSADQLDRADALVLFAPRGDLAGENPIFYTLYPGGEAGRGRLPLHLPQALAAQLAPNCGFEQMAAALYAQGALSLEDLLAETLIS